MNKRGPTKIELNHARLEAAVSNLAFSANRVAEAFEDFAFAALVAVNDDEALRAQEISESVIFIASKKR